MRDWRCGPWLAFRPEVFAPDQAVLPEVPDMDVMKKDLAFAGIDYGNGEIGYADLHAQRMTLNMVLASHGVAGRVRQAHLRHTDPRLTEATYFDASLFLKPHADELNQVPPIACGAIVSAEPIAETTCAKSVAQLMHKTGGSSGHFGATVVNEEVTVEGSAIATEGTSQVMGVTWDGTNGQGPASCDTGPSEKRAKGVEPSTFTLATCRSTTELRPRGVNLRKYYTIPAGSVKRPGNTQILRNCSRNSPRPIPSKSV